MKSSCCKLTVVLHKDQMAERCQCKNFQHQDGAVQDRIVSLGINLAPYWKGDHKLDDYMCLRDAPQAYDHSTEQPKKVLHGDQVAYLNGLA
jgi:hypothetical protein